MKKNGALIISKGKLLKWIAFILVLMFAFLIRRHTFSLPHIRGDQSHYVALAYKLDNFGINAYNLRGVNIYLYDPVNKTDLAYVEKADDKGSILKNLEKANITYYDEPFHHVPFGFPIALTLSHKLFARGAPYYILRVPNDTQVIKNAPKSIGIRAYKFDAPTIDAHFYAVILPFVFSLLFISTVYLLAKTMFGSKTIALIAMFLITISPIDILTSQKVWADDMTAFFSTLAVFCYMVSINRKWILFAMIGGISCGVSTATKLNGAFVGIPILICHFILSWKKPLTLRSFLKVFFDPYLLLFFLGAAVGSGYWFYKIYSAYGEPLYMPHQPGLVKESTIGWFKALSRRPRYTYLVGIPFQNPLFFLAYFSPLIMIWKRSDFKKLFFLFVWISTFMYIFYTMGGLEHRYILPAYPAFAILGAYTINIFRVFLDKRTRLKLGSVIVAALLILSACWSVPMGLQTLFSTNALILRPF